MKIKLKKIMLAQNDNLRRLGQWRKPLQILAIAFLLLATACQAASSDGNSTWTGFLEGKTIDVASQVGGRVATVTVQEGDRVQAGQTLVTLDDEFIRLQIQAADANIAAAQAQLDLLQAGARPEDLHRAQARVAQAQAGLNAATTALADMQAIRANPQTLVILKTDAETKTIAATQQLTATLKQAQAADLENKFWEDLTRNLWDGVDIRLPKGGTLHFDTPQARINYASEQWSQAGNAAWQAWAAYAQAQANVTAAQNGLKDLGDQITNPIALDTRVNETRAAKDGANAILQTAQAALQIVQDGASPAQVQTARAALEQAQAARTTLDQDRAKYTITAPQAGTVTRVAYRAGEIAAPTMPLVRLSVNGELTLRVFVPMSQLDTIKLNDAVRVFVNEQNNRTLTGRITTIADHAEFSGRTNQTDNDRNAQLVGVEIAITNTDSAIKAGMPASVAFGNAPASMIGATIINDAGTLTFSGSLEAKQTRIAAEFNGTVKTVRAQRGDAVQSGDPLIELDDATIKTQLAEADATVRTAQANLDQVNEKPRAGNLALAQAGVAQANSDAQAANTALADATRALNDQQTTAAQIHAWESKVQAAQSDVAKAQAVLAGIKNQVDLAANDQSMSGKTALAILQAQQQAAEAGLSAAQANASGNQRVLDLYRAQHSQPLELLAAQHHAASQVEIAKAGIQVAQAELEMAQREPQKQAVALAQAKLRAAQTALQIAQAQAKRYTLTSPLNATVIARTVEPGETVRAGAPLLTLADTRELELTVYVPIRNIGTIQVGQGATIRVPSLPGKNFVAQVKYIAPEAEFQPANIYNSKERSEMVFTVRVTVANPNSELKAGLPADVIFSAQ